MNRTNNLPLYGLLLLMLGGGWIIGNLMPPWTGYIGLILCGIGINLLLFFWRR